MSAQRSATVIGAGVSGLTTAYVLLAAGWQVRVVARQPFEECVSRVAAAIWTSTTAEPMERTRPWALRSRERFAEFAADPATGVRPLRQREFELKDMDMAAWEATGFVRRLRDDELPDGYQAGFEIDGFSIEPSICLSWLRDEVRRLGAEFEIGEVSRIEELDAEVVVNCAGLGSVELIGDTTMFPIRGQVVTIDKAARSGMAIEDGVSDESENAGIAYVYPRSTDVVLGGTRESGQFGLEPDPATTERILRDCAALEPRVMGATAQEVRVGLRPGRPQVRLELDPEFMEFTVVHNYGHSGAGYILSWGCAEEVLQMLSQGSPDGATVAT